MVSYLLWRQGNAGSNPVLPTYSPIAERSSEGLIHSDYVGSIPTGANMNITLNKKTVDSITLNLSVEEYVIIQSLLSKIACAEIHPSRVIFNIYDEMCKNTGNPTNSPVLPSVIHIKFNEEKLQKEVERISNYES